MSWPTSSSRLTSHSVPQRTRFSSRGRWLCPWWKAVSEVASPAGADWDNNTSRESNVSPRQFPHCNRPHTVSVRVKYFFFFSVFPYMTKFFKTHNQLGNASDLHRGRPWCYVFFPEPTTSLAREDDCNFTAFSGTFLPGFSLFNVCPLSSTFSLSLFMLTIFLALAMHWLSVVWMLVCIQSVTRDESDHRSYHQVKSQGKGRQPRALWDIVVALCYSVFGFATGQSARQAAEKSVSASNGQFWPKP